MENSPPSKPANQAARLNLLFGGLTVAFLVLAVLFTKNLWGYVPPKQNIPLVDKKFLETTPWRQTYTDLVKAKEDLSDYDCYGCHEKNKPPPIRYDENQKIII